MEEEIWKGEKICINGESGLSWVVFSPCLLESWQEPCSLVSKRHRTSKNQRFCSPLPGGCFFPSLVLPPPPRFLFFFNLHTSGQLKLHSVIILSLVLLVLSMRGNIYPCFFADLPKDIFVVAWMRETLCQQGQRDGRGTMSGPWCYGSCCSAE